MAHADAVAVKLPSFWTSSPTAWFAQAEAQFAIRGITQDDTKYYYVVAALDNETATRAIPIISSPPEINKYISLKSFLISAYDLSDEERASALFTQQGLGDFKPSELMDRMLSLLGTHKPCFLFKHLYMQQLPHFVRMTLANSKIEDFRQLALEADKIYSTGRNQYSAVDLVNDVRTGQQRHNKPASTSGSSQEKVRPTPPVCWYHNKYGTKAQKCVPPCKHHQTFLRNQGNGQLGQQ